MLAIRMQRSGRKGHAMFRVVVQDSHRTPTSGKLVAHLGSYDPHAKTIIVDKEKAQFYLDHGAQPSDRVARLLKAEGVTLPKWVLAAEQKQRTVRNADKRRSTRPEVPAEETAPEAVADEAPAEEAPASTPPAAEEPDSPSEPEAADEAPSAPPIEETPAAEPADAPSEAVDDTPEQETPAESEETPATAEAPEEPPQSE